MLGFGMLFVPVIIVIMLGFGMFFVPVIIVVMLGFGMFFMPMVIVAVFSLGVFLTMVVIVRVKICTSAQSQLGNAWRIHHFNDLSTTCHGRYWFGKGGRQIRPDPEDDIRALEQEGLRRLESKAVRRGRPIYENERFTNTRHHSRRDGMQRLDGGDHRRRIRLGGPGHGQENTSGGGGQQPLFWRKGGNATRRGGHTVYIQRNVILLHVIL